MLPAIDLRFLTCTTIDTFNGHTHTYIYDSIIGLLNDFFLLKVHVGSSGPPSVGVFRELSWSLSCPAFCGPSVIPIFLSGIFVGLVLGIALGAYLLWTLDLGARRSTPSAGSPEVVRGPGATRVRSRLSGYLHE